MYDSLEGLDYAHGECSHYVSKILKDVTASKMRGDLVEKDRDNISIGDVYVGGFSSHLVRDIHTYPPYRPNEKKCLIIPKSVLERKRSERKK